MYLTTDLNPNSGFTRILNETIFDDRLSHSEFRFWCRLLALQKGADQVLMDAEDIAKELGMTTDACRKQRRILKEKGFLLIEKTRIVVTIPAPEFQPKEVTLSKEQQLRHDLRDAWNDARPESFTRLRNPVAEAQVETLKLHAEHNKQTDLCAFLRSVLRGCKADDWWKEKNMNFANVFGTGSPKQNKFTNVEKLVNLSGSKKGRAALFDVNDDQCWIDWFEAKTLSMTKVVRLEMEQDDAWVHQVDNDGDGTIYIYTQGDRMVHWTYKENHVGVSYIPTAR